MKESISRKAYNEVINEVEMMKRITHPNIIQMYDSFLDRQYDTNALKKRSERTESQGRTFDESMKSSKPHTGSPQVKPNGISLYIAMEYAELGDM